MADELVHLAVGKGVATITLDSPHNRNALSAQLRRELLGHLTTAVDDDAVRVIVLDHTGPVFCAGMDLKEAGGAPSGNPGGGGPPAGGRNKQRPSWRRPKKKYSVNEFPAILALIWNNPKPVVAKLAGPARAGGVGVVAAADIAVAAEDASFAFTEVRIGVVPAVISVTVLPRLLPRAAHELFLTGEKFDARRAVAIGLLNAAVPAGELDAEVRRYTDMLALGGPKALAATKEVLRRTRSDDMAEDLAAMAALSAGFFAGEEGQEGILAFAQKRTPNWVP